jgi:hypothetical protein
VTATRDAIAVPDSTQPAIALLRELRRGHGKKQAASVAYWVYLVAFLVLVYGGSVIAAAVRALRHPPAATAQTPHVLQAAPAGLAALALIVLVVLARDALWRGPVTLPQAAVDWLLGTPVDRGALLRPRFRLSAALAILAGAAAGIVPAAALVALGLGAGNGGAGNHGASYHGARYHGASGVLRLTGASMLSMALLFAFATGVAGLIERYPASWPWLRRVTPVAVAVAAAFAGLATWAMLGRPPAVLADIALWSGPWGWAGQATVAAAGGAAPLWPLAIGALGLLAVAALARAHRAAAGVPGPALRIRAATLGAISAAAFNMDTRSVAVAYSAAGAARRARFRLRPPRQRQLVLFWRDLLALGRAPSRLVGAVALTLLAVGLIAVARRGGRDPLVPVACALALGYLAAAWLCEGARLDADDTRRSVPLPFRFASLAWWHAAVPCLVLLVVAGVPGAALCLAAGDPRLLVLLVAVPVLIGGAMVNVFRGQYPPDLFSGVDTPFGNTAAVRIVFWYAWGPILAVAPMAVLASSAIGTPDPAALARALVIGAALAAAFGAYAARRAGRLRAG